MLKKKLKAKKPTYKSLTKTSFQKHPFHVLGFSRLPVLTGFFAGILAILIIMKLHSVNSPSNFLLAAKLLFQPGFKLSIININSLQVPFMFIDSYIVHVLFCIALIMWVWGKELMKESTTGGFHTIEVQRGLRYGVILFLASEAMLFFPFFWAFFHASLSPSVLIGSIWPPEGIRESEVLDAFMLPLVNTVILLTSGLSLLASHRALIAGNYKLVLDGLFGAVCLGILFSWLQFIEYGLTLFTINDTVFGSTFFLLTGLHGFHVFVGTCLLLLTYIRAKQYHFSRQHHNLFEASAWYWHFVDVVWLFVFCLVYIWGM